jgi:hypothetical protein
MDYDHSPNLGVLDEVGALLAGLCGDVDGSSHTPFESCLKDSIVLCVDSEAWVLVIVSTGRNIRVRKLAPGAASFITVKLS